jgi:hypothetical protein
LTATSGTTATWQTPSGGGGTLQSAYNAGQAIDLTAAGTGLSITSGASNKLSIAKDTSTGIANTLNIGDGNSVILLAGAVGQNLFSKNSGNLVSNTYTVTPFGHTSLTFTGNHHITAVMGGIVLGGQVFHLLIKQTGGGGFSPVWDAPFIVLNPPTINTAANGVTIITCIVDNTTAIYVR